MACLKLLRRGSLSNYGGHAKDDAKLKMNLYFTFEFDNYLDLFRTPIGLKTCSKYIMPAINSKKRLEKLAVVADVL